MSIVIDPTELSETALNNLIDACILQHGTDYGQDEHSLETKREQCRQQLLSGKAIITYDPESDSCGIQPRLI